MYWYSSLQFSVPYETAGVREGLACFADVVYCIDTKYEEQNNEGARVESRKPAQATKKNDIDGRRRTLPHRDEDTADRTSVKTHQKIDGVVQARSAVTTKIMQMRARWLPSLQLHSHHIVIDTFIINNQAGNTTLQYHIIICTFASILS